MSELDCGGKVALLRCRRGEENVASFPESDRETVTRKCVTGVPESAVDATSPAPRGTGPRSVRRAGVDGLGRVELHPADVQILFKAVELEEVGELQGADIAASLADLPLGIADDPLQIGFGKARVKEFIPEPFPIKEQAHALPGQAAVQRVSQVNAFEHELLRARGPPIDSP